MQWLEAIWTKEGKGIDKHAPKRTGLALFGEIIASEGWELVKLNLLFILASLPLVGKASDCRPGRRALRRLRLSQSPDEREL
jgi:hypothetical protein